MQKIIDLSRTKKVPTNAPGSVFKKVYVPIADVAVPVVTAMEYDRNTDKPTKGNHFAALLERGLNIVEESGLIEITPADLEVDRLENSVPASQYILEISGGVNDRIKTLYKIFFADNPLVKSEQFCGALIRIGANATRRVDAPKFVKAKAKFEAEREAMQTDPETDEANRDAYLAASRFGEI